MEANHACSWRISVVTIAIDDRVLKTFDEAKNAWNLTKGEYQVMAGWFLGRYAFVGESCGSLKL
jgi:hypothetical protein